MYALVQLLIVLPRLKITDVQQFRIKIFHWLETTSDDCRYRKLFNHTVSEFSTIVMCFQLSFNNEHHELNEVLRKSSYNTASYQEL